MNRETRGVSEGTPNRPPKPATKSIHHATPPSPVPSVTSLRSNWSMATPPELTREFTESISDSQSVNTEPLSRESSVRSVQSDPTLTHDARSPSPAMSSGIFTWSGRSLEQHHTVASEFPLSTSASSDEPGCVVCAVCPRRAFKSCLTCMASFCEVHVTDHYTAPDLQRHKLVEATDDLEQRVYQLHHRDPEFYCRTDQTKPSYQMKESGLDVEWTGQQGNLRSSSEVDHLPTINLTVECELIKTGPPDCYLLPTEKSNIDECGEVRRCTFGKRDESKIVKNILIVGETGTGKTTLINTMVNYMLGVKWGDGVWYQITEGKHKSQASSQTDNITVYEAFVETSPLSLRLIDTPGYGSTDGIKGDWKTTENLHILFKSEDGIDDISVVCLVVKSGCNFLTDSQLYIFDAIISLFGKDIEKNIVVMITHSDGISVDDVFAALNEANVPCAKDASGDPLHFMFNNLQSKGYKGKKEDAFWRAWDLGCNSMESFLVLLKDIEVRKLKMTEDVLRKRKQLEACVSNLQDAIKMEELKQNQLLQAQRALEENNEKYENNEDFSYEVDEPYKAEVPIESSWWHLTKSATCCTVCEENCHYPGCWWVKDLSWCSAMKDGCCTVCSNKCPVSSHIKQKMIYVPKTRKMKKTYKELKHHYEPQVDMKTALENDIKESKDKKIQLLKGAYECVVKLEDIALKKDSGSTLIHLDFLIEKMKEMGDDGKVQKLLDLSKLFQVSNTSRLVQQLTILRNAAQPVEQNAYKAKVMDSQPEDNRQSQSVEEGADESKA